MHCLQRSALANEARTLEAFEFGLRISDMKFDKTLFLFKLYVSSYAA